MNYEISNEDIMRIITTLKEIDVRGYESMNRIVALVLLFERMMEGPSIEQKAEAIRQQNPPQEA